MVEQLSDDTKIMGLPWKILKVKGGLSDDYQKSPWWPKLDDAAKATVEQLRAKEKQMEAPGEIERAVAEVEKQMESLEVKQEAKQITTDDERNAEIERLAKTVEQMKQVEKIKEHERNMKAYKER